MSSRPSPAALGAAAAALTALAAASVLALEPSPGQRASADNAARGLDLARRVVAAQSSRGFLVRARVVVGDEPAGGAPPTILQIRMLGRRERAGDRLLFQVLWPTAMKGHALVLERRERTGRTGFLFDPPSTVTPLTRALAAEPFAGTALTPEDLADDFWRWPAQRFAGVGRDGQRYCSLLESEPPAEAESAYTLVRSCIETARHTPRWVEKLGAGGTVVKRISFERARSGSGGGGATLTMVVEGPRVPPTRVEFVRQDRDVEVAPQEFTVERLGRLGLAPPPR